MSKYPDEKYPPEERTAHSSRLVVNGIAALYPAPGVEHILSFKILPFNCLSKSPIKKQVLRSCVGNLYMSF